VEGEAVLVYTAVGFTTWQRCCCWWLPRANRLFDHHKLRSSVGPVLSV